MRPVPTLTLRLKINLIVGVLTLLFAVAMLALELRSMRESVREEVVAANRVAAQLLDRTVWRHAAQGTPALLVFLQGLGRVRSNDISLFGADGQLLYSSPPSPYKVGRDAPAWFAELVSPPLAEKAIAFADGRMVVRANASRAALDAWDDIVGLLLTAAALLLVVNGLVFWLVGRTVRPFAQIVTALNRLEGGRFDTALPRLAGREAAAIGAAFNRMVAELQRHLETERRALHAELQLSDSRELTRWIDQHVEQERRLIARELHDELGQSVTAMRSMALAIAQRLHGVDAHSENAARLIAEESSRLYEAMHGIIPRLTTLVLDNFGLADALNDLAERTRRSQTGVRVSVSVDLAEAWLAAEPALALFRAAQEGITNALRHGHAQALTLTLQGRADKVTLALVDDGEGLPPGWQLGSQGLDHHGLRWLAERFQALGGSLEVSPALPRGVEFRAWLPLQKGPA
jgi:two-component system sensor histidine kinase UhpB